MNDATRQFIEQNLDADVRQLALKGAKDQAVDLALALSQIAGLQTARRKLPSWAALGGLLFPQHLSLEQCSSEQTARYKADLLRRLGASGRMADLTGGFGVDFAFMAPLFSEAIYVERQEQLCAIAEHNFPLLGLHHTRIVCADGLGFLSQQTEPIDWLFLDPARRDDHGGRTYGIADCTPDVLAAMPLLRQKARHLLLKLSPMLDWRKALQDLGPELVGEVHIVAVGNECKELLLQLDTTPRADQAGPALFCINDDKMVRFEAGEAACLNLSTADRQVVYCPKTNCLLPIDKNSFGSIQNQKAQIFLYEPNAAIMKSGCFEALARRYGVEAVAPNSHLFVSHEPVSDFPGRQFSIEAMTTMNKRELKAALTMRQANISVRNFPLTVAQLRQRLKLSDGGDHYLFATTLTDGRHVIFVCKKL